MRSKIISSSLLLVFVNEIGPALISEHRKEQTESHNANFRLTTEVLKARTNGEVTEKLTVNLNPTSFYTEEQLPGPTPPQRKLPIIKSTTKESLPITTTELLAKNAPSHGNSSESSTDLIVTTEVHHSTTETVFALQIASAAIASLAGGGIG